MIPVLQTVTVGVSPNPESMLETNTPLLQIGVYSFHSFTLSSLQSGNSPLTIRPPPNPWSPRGWLFTPFLACLVTQVILCNVTVNLTSTLSSSTTITTTTTLSIQLPYILYRQLLSLCQRLCTLSQAFSPILPRRLRQLLSPQLQRLLLSHNLMIRNRQRHRLPLSHHLPRRHRVPPPKHRRRRCTLSPSLRLPRRTLIIMLRLLITLAARIHAAPLTPAIPPLPPKHRPPIQRALQRAAPDRLRNVVVHARAHALLPVPLDRARRHRHDRYRPRSRPVRVVVPDHVRRPVPVDHGHLHVHEDGVGERVRRVRVRGRRRGLEQVVECFAAVPGGGDAIAEFADGAEGDLLVDGAGGGGGG